MAGPIKVFKQVGELKTGYGKVTGIIALSLAILCFLGVLAFHFPQYLTTPQLRKNYSVDLLRQVMLIAMVVAGALGLVNLIRRRQRSLNAAALVLVLLSWALGGHQVPVGDFPDHTPYIGVDWFILDLLGSTLVFILIEKIFIVEVHHEHFILRIAGTHQIERRLVYSFALFTHRAGIVNHDSHRHRNIFMTKRNNVLRLPIFKYKKVGTIKIRHQPQFVVHHGGVQQHFVHLLVEDERAAFVVGWRC